MVASKSSVFHLVIEMEDTLNHKVIKDIDLSNYLREQDSILFYAFILHDKDVNEDKEIVRPHYHLIIVYKSQYVKRSIITEFANTFEINVNCVSCRSVKDIVLSIQYLIHKNDKDKYKYDELDIWTNNVDELYLSLFEGQSSYDCDITYLINLVNSCNSISEIYYRLGLKKSRTYRSIIIDLYKEKILR